MNWGETLWGVGTTRQVSARPSPVTVESPNSPNSLQRERYSGLLPELSPSPHKAKRSLSQMKPKPRDWDVLPSPRKVAMAKATKPTARAGHGEEVAVVLPGSVPSPTVHGAGSAAEHRSCDEARTEEEKKRNGGVSEIVGAMPPSTPDGGKRGSLAVSAAHSSDDDDVEGSGGTSRGKRSPDDIVAIGGSGDDDVKHVHNATDVMSVRGKGLGDGGMSFDRSLASAMMDKLHLNSVNSIVGSGIGTMQHAIMSGIDGIKNTLVRGADSVHGLADAAHVLRVCVGTWNMGGKVCPDDLDLSGWLPRDKFDVYVVGVQECEQGEKTTTAITHP